MEKMTFKGNEAVLHVNPKMYPLETVYSAAYVFLDTAYFMLDGDPEKDIIVTIKLKEKGDVEKVGGEFLNQLMNYADYRERAKRTEGIREMLLQRALVTNDSSIIRKACENEDQDFEKIFEDLGDDDYLDDPEGIAIPWEEKYGKDENKTQ